MKPDQKSNHSIQELISDFPPEIQLLTLQIRSIILNRVSTANEKVNPGWRSISYKHPDVGYFCGILPNEDYVDLIFEFGVLLQDPDKILMGKGSQVRFIRFHSVSDIKVQQLGTLIDAAISLPESRTVRIQMVKSGAKQIPQTRKSK